MKKNYWIAILGVTTMLIAGQAAADSLSGRCITKSGQKCGEKVHSITTSWNSKTGYPDSRGNYSIDFGSTVGSKISVYCDGNSAGEVSVKGSTQHDVVCK